MITTNSTTKQPWYKNRLSYHGKSSVIELETNWKETNSVYRKVYAECNYDRDIPSWLKQGELIRVPLVVISKDSKISAIKTQLIAGSCKAVKEGRRWVIVLAPSLASYGKLSETNLRELQLEYDTIVSSYDPYEPVKSFGKNNHNSDKIEKSYTEQEMQSILQKTIDEADAKTQAAIDKAVAEAEERLRAEAAIVQDKMQDQIDTLDSRVLTTEKHIKVLLLEASCAQSDLNQKMYEMLDERDRNDLETTKEFARAKSAAVLVGHLNKCYNK